MNESNELLLAIEQLKRSNRRWKTLAHTVSIVLVSVAFFLMIGVSGSVCGLKPRCSS